MYCIPVWGEGGYGQNIHPWGALDTQRALTVTLDVQTESVSIK